MEITYRVLAESAAICAAHGVRYAFLSPGSRSAPVALSFLRNKDIQCYIWPDERSAAYAALGMARQTATPVVLVCTSGTAALNYAPAVAEAFFSQIPLLVLTADRPPEWIAQADNQSIFQDHIYNGNIKFAYTFPVDFNHADARWKALRIMNEACNRCLAAPQGPVHINIPLREPLYLDHVPEFEVKDVQIIKAIEPADLLLPVDVAALSGKKILIVAGMYHPAWKQEEEKLSAALSICMEKGCAFVADVASNLHSIPGALLFSDLVLNMEKDTDALAPDVLITFGGPVVSKPLKEFLRRKNIRQHWHIGQGDVQPDTFQRLSAIIKMPVAGFFTALEQQISPATGYGPLWQKFQEHWKPKAQKALSALPWCEASAVYQVLMALPAGTVLHLGNSMPVRYASAFPFFKNVSEVYANRGTSGIDGSVSSAAGQSLVSAGLHVLIAGDMSFLYDSNGLWNNYLRGNFKIIVLNNHGGGIFRELPGPAMQPERDHYFVVNQPLHMEHLSRQFGLDYFFCDEIMALDKVLAEFLSISDKPSLLELNFTHFISLSDIRENIA